MAARPLVERPPNERLRGLLQEMGVSNAGLARRVNLCGAEHGLDLRYDKTSVSRWLRGQRPRGMTPDILAEVLSDKLGRPVSVDEIGIPNGKRRQEFGVGLIFSPTLSGAVDQACDLWRSDANRRNFLGRSTVAVFALLGPGREWLATRPDPAVPRIGGVRVGTADVELLRTVTRDLADLDHRFGSGHVRPMALHCLNHVVSRLLKGSYREATGRQLFAAAARLTELVGYMAVDAGRPGLAQRYYIQALRLSQAAGDRAFGGYVMTSGMSHLAASLGHVREIIRLGSIAEEGIRGRVTPTMRAVLHAAQARGYALAGDVPACEFAAGKAVDALDQAVSDSEPEWLTHFGGAYLADELAHCYVALRQPVPAARHAEEALAGHPEFRVRRRTIGLLLLAMARLQAGEVDEACDTATRAVELLRHLRSGLAVGYLRDFRALAATFHQESVVREFEKRVAEIDLGTLGP